MKNYSALFSRLYCLTPLAHSEGFLQQIDFKKSEPELMPVDQAFAFDFKQEGNQVKLICDCRRLLHVPRQV